MNIQKIRKADKSQRLTVLVDELYVTDASATCPGLVLSVEMMLREMQKYHFYVDTKSHTVVLSDDDGSGKNKVVISEKDGVVEKTPRHNTYNAYEFLEFYLGLGANPPCNFSAVRFRFPLLLPINVTTGYASASEIFWYDFITERLLNAFKYQVSTLRNADEEIQQITPEMALDGTTLA